MQRNSIIIGAAALVVGVLMAVWAYNDFKELDGGERIHWAGALVYQFTGPVGLAIMLGLGAAGGAAIVTWLIVRPRKPKT